MIKNTANSYGKIAKYLHWIMAVLFILMFMIAYLMTNIPKSDFRLSLYDLHKATGLLLIGLLIVRLGWRFISIQPQAPKGMPLLQSIAAKTTILFLYILMIIMPASGFLTSTLGGHAISFYGLFSIAPLGHSETLSEFYANAHEYISYVLIGIFTLHVAGALYHHFKLKDNVLRRMM